MKKRIAEFLKSILAGLAISVGGMVYLACENKAVGAVLFSAGLITVVSFGLNLYTGRIGYVPENGGVFFADTVLSIPGNLVGCLIAGLLKSPIGAVETLCEAKLAKPLGGVLIDACLCGLLIYICVDIFKKRKTYLGILICIPTFILAGFEHSVADMFYLINARVFHWQAVVFVLVVVAGNAIGGLLIPLCLRLYDRLSAS